MFLYLNSCPKNIIKSQIRKSFEDYLFNENVQKIIIFLNRIIIKSKGEDETVKESALAMLNKIHDLKGLNFQKLEVMSTSTSVNDTNTDDMEDFQKGFNLHKFCPFFLTRTAV